MQKIRMVRVVLNDLKGFLKRRIENSRKKWLSTYFLLILINKSSKEAFETEMEALEKTKSIKIKIKTLPISVSKPFCNIASNYLLDGFTYL